MMAHDLIVIGAGSAGLTAAGGAAMFGLKVALIEQGAMGGECLNTGCVPSKALIASAARAHAGRQGRRLGIALAPPDVDFAAVRRHLQDTIAAIAPHDSQERFEALGVEVIRAPARFLDRRTLLAGNRRLRAPRIVIATGSRPALPPLAGLADVPYLTNETLFALEALPGHLLILGGGAIGCEMAQAFRRLGSAVTVIEAERPLARDDHEAAQVVTARLAQEGVVFISGATATRVDGAEGAIRLELEDGREVTGTHLLVATGREANVASLDLGAAGVRHGKGGITVDARRRTSNRQVFAIGDCRAGPRFTHVAGYEGSLVALQVATGWPARGRLAGLPRVTYTDPELAQIGLTEAEARARYSQVDVTREAFADNDRAVTQGDTAGFLKLVRHRGKVGRRHARRRRMQARSWPCRGRMLIARQDLDLWGLSRRGGRPIPRVSEISPRRSLFRPMKDGCSGRGHGAGRGCSCGFGAEPAPGPALLPPGESGACLPEDQEVQQWAVTAPVASPFRPAGRPRAWTAGQVRRTRQDHGSWRAARRGRRSSALRDALVQYRHALQSSPARIAISRVRRGMTRSIYLDGGRGRRDTSTRSRRSAWNDARDRFHRRRAVPQPRPASAMLEDVLGPRPWRSARAHQRDAADAPARSGAAAAARKRMDDALTLRVSLDHHTPDVARRGARRRRSWAIALDGLTWLSDRQGFSGRGRRAASAGRGATRRARAGYARLFAADAASRSTPRTARASCCFPRWMPAPTSPRSPPDAGASWARTQPT